MTGRDLIGVAQTGTGKTAAFCLPLLARLLAEPASTALVLAPTRELIQQIEVFWRRLTAKLPEARCVSLIGGVSMKQQLRALASQPRLILATPGRLLDHLNRRTAKLDHCRALVLDEADRMLDLGFEPQLAKIRRQLPASRQTLFFTATWDPATDRLAQSYLQAPERVTIGPASRPVEAIDQSVRFVDQKSKNSKLLDAVNERRGSILVFARTQTRTDRVAKYLASFGLDVQRLHGGRTQAQRGRAMSAFREGECRILVATDIAARGLDISSVAHVINYDLPMVAEDYVHRIGRTGRAGASGTALSFITAEDRDLWRAIARLLEKTGAQVPELPDGANGAQAPKPAPQSERLQSTAQARRQKKRRSASPFSSSSRGWRR